MILGAGQYGNVAKEIAESTGQYEQIAFLDDKSSIAIGIINELDKFIDEYENAIVAIGNPIVRLELIEKLISTGYSVPILIHTKAYISQTVKLGYGCIVELMAVIHTEAVIGTGCIISAGATVNHNSVIGDGCYIDCGSVIGAKIHIDAMTQVEYGQIIRE